MNPLETRRREDLRRVRALCERSGGKLQFVATDSETPSQVRIRMRYRTAVDPSYPQQWADSVEMRIAIPAGYPFRSGPSAYLSPVVWHPNVFPSGQVCQGSKWLISEYLDLYVKRIARIVTFQDDVLNLQSVANRHAALWYQRLLAESPALFPTDTVESIESSEPSGGGGIRWKDGG
jgi:hypothetical protein